MVQGPPVDGAKVMGKGLTVGRGGVSLTLICADEHGESRVGNVETLLRKRSSRTVR